MKEINQYQRLVSDYNIVSLNPDDRQCINICYHKAVTYLNDDRNHDDFTKIARVKYIKRTLENLL